MDENLGHEIDQALKLYRHHVWIFRPLYLYPD